MAWAYSDQQHNGDLATEAKVDLRRKVLAAMPGPAHVFDAFCGPDGAMYDAVWRDAASYVGCDLKWRIGDGRRRYVGDTSTVMRSIELGAFNVFDFDAFGSPWQQMMILGARRRWTSGETGAVVLTDGSTTRTKFGLLSHELATFFRRPVRNLPSTGAKQANALHDLALREWLRRHELTPLHAWSAVGRSNARGNQEMRYLAVVFRRGEAATARPPRESRGVRTPPASRQGRA